MTKHSGRKLRILKEKTEKSLHKVSSKLRERKTQFSMDKTETNSPETWGMAHKLVGKKTEMILPLFKDLDQNLQKSGLRVNFKAYVSLTMLASLVITLIVGFSVPLLLLLILQMPLTSSLLFGFGGGLFTWVISIVFFYLYPIYRADKRRRELEDEMPFTTGYMAILANAGVAPEKIFHSISTLNPPLSASIEAKEVIKNVNLFGLDIISALEKTSSRTPSERFRGIIEGIISTIHTGANLGNFLRNKFKIAMKLKKISLKKFAHNLSVLSEIYVALLLTGPLLMVIMASVMSVMGGGDLGMLSPDLMLSLLTYIAIPVCSVIFLIILDATTPKW